MKIETFNPDPFQQFVEWFDFAKSQGLREPEGAALATATPNARPSVRIVLFRGMNDRGFLFHTNYNSRKAQEMISNPQAALCFYWQSLDRQVRIDGTIEKATREESDAYWQTRRPDSQISALASDQSRPISSRATLEKEVLRLQEEWAGKKIPRPEHWGGFCLVPQAFEFWQAHPDRLHHRVLYERDGMAWTSKTLAP